MFSKVDLMCHNESYCVYGFLSVHNLHLGFSHCNHSPGKKSNLYSRLTIGTLNSALCQVFIVIASKRI